MRKKKDTKKLIQTGIREEDERMLKALADAEGDSITSYLRRMIRKHLEGGKL
jgi:hypothetical protein